MEPGRLTVAVIHHRTPELLWRCLERLELHVPGAELLVVDADSRDGSAAEVARRHPRVRVLEVPNHSLAAGVNAALRASSRPLFAHLNADVFVEADTFPRLADALEPADAAMAGPLCRTPDGRLQDQGLPYRLHPLRLELERRESVPVPWLSGCLQLVRRDAVAAVGGMDASLRFYNEDLEWCWRLRRAGRRCLLVACEVEHVGGASTPSDPRFLVEGYRGGMVLSRRYLPPWYRAAHRAFVRLEAAVRARLEGRPQRREAYRAIARMFATGAFDDSPFGPTLRDANPHGPLAPPSVGSAAVRGEC